MTLTLLLPKISSRERFKIKLRILAIIAVLSVVFAGCSSEKNESSNITMDGIVQAFEDGGATKSDEKPLYQLIGASEGVMLKLGNSTVKIYEYKSEKELNDARSKFEIIKDMPSKGKFLLDTKNEEAIQIFENIK